MQQHNPRSRRPGTGISRRAVVHGAVGMALAGGSGATLPARAAGKPALSVAVGVDVITLDPDRIPGGNEYLFMANVFEGLFGHDETGKVTPLLAESVTPSADGLVHDFTLRGGAIFHNGDPVTAEDVRFSWQRAVAPEMRNPRASVLVANIADVEVLDERHCRLKLKHRDASLMENLGEFFYIKPKKHLQSVGDDAFDKQPVGTGPFAFVDRRIKSYIKLRGFDGHWGRVPKVGEVTLKIVPDDQARVAQVQTGESDIAVNVPPVLAAPLQRMPNLKIVRAPSFGNIFIAINARNTALAKPEVRRALNMAIDKPTLLKTVMFGYATVQDLPCHPDIIGCNAKVEPYGYDPQRAREMLVKAGFDFSRPLHFLGMAPGRVAQSQETVEGVAFFLNKIGVKTEITILDYGAWISIFGGQVKDPAVDLVFANFTDYNNDPSGRLLRQIRTGGTYTWYSNPEVDARLDRMNDFASTAEREDFLRGVFTTLHEEAPLITLWTLDSVYAMNKAIQWNPTPNVSWPVLWNVAKSA
jgi:peptide/nickel transport system substrate-binding protein